MIAGQEINSERELSWEKQYRFKTDVSRSCCILGGYKKDVASVRVDAQAPPGASIQISKDVTRAAMRLSFVLPFRSLSTGQEIRLQVHYALAQGRWAGASSLSVTDERGKCTPVVETGPAHVSTWQGQTTASAHFRILRDIAATGHDRLVWAMELDTDAISCVLIAVSICIDDCWLVYTGAELLHGEAALRDAAALPPRDDLASLIHMFETQYDAWSQTRRDLMNEIEHLRRSLDEAQLKPAPASSRGA
jgi:hypothetical protein